MEKRCVARGWLTIDGTDGLNPDFRHLRGQDIGKGVVRGIAGFELFEVKIPTPIDDRGVKKYFAPFEVSTSFFPRGFIGDMGGKVTSDIRIDEPPQSTTDPDTMSIFGIKGGAFRDARGKGQPEVLPFAIAYIIGI